MFDTHIMLFDDFIADVEIEQLDQHWIPDHLFHHIVDIEHPKEKRTFLLFSQYYFELLPEGFFFLGWLDQSIHHIEDEYSDGQVGRLLEHIHASINTIINLHSMSNSMMKDFLDQLNRIDQKKEKVEKKQKKLTFKEVFIPLFIHSRDFNWSKTKCYWGNRRRISRRSK